MYAIRSYYVWNFTPVKLKTPDDVVSQKEDLSSGLAVLSVKFRITSYNVCYTKLLRKKMIDEGKYCIDIITQISAIRSALSSLSGIILQNHIEHCLVHAFEQQDKELQEKMIKEIMDVYKKHA